jgi:hypothetical protein
MALPPIIISKRQEADNLSSAFKFLKEMLSNLTAADLENYVNVKLSRKTILDRGEFLGDVEDLSTELAQIFELRDLPGARKPKKQPEEDTDHGTN